jgi:hypothetical protein
LNSPETRRGFYLKPIPLVAAIRQAALLDEFIDLMPHPGVTEFAVTRLILFVW